jgi:murein L,D-transpeptidase YafK
LARSLLASAVIATAAALGGCNADRTPSVSDRHAQPLSEKMLVEIEKKSMVAQSGILIRIFKEESELEVWKEDKSGRLALLRTFPICRWSGELGPKIKAGDRQAPEGFYTITPGLMNPNSQYHLAINTGFPNAYDRANDRTGSFLMIHGDCSSAGCYAMTDEQIAEIYALARESFLGGQRSFQVQAYPFRMTPLNMARHRDSPHMAFWRMLKQGYDHFEVTHLSPKVDVCERRYVFDAETSGEFDPVDRCPSYKVPEDIAARVGDKQHRDDIRTAELINRGTPAAPVTNGGKGGMNRTFLAAIAQSGPGVTIRTASGTIPSHVHPPPDTAETAITLNYTESRPAPGPRPSPRIASAAPASSDVIGGLLGNRFRSKDEDSAGSASRGSQPAEAAAPSPKPAIQTVTAGALRPISEPQTADTKTTNAVVPRPRPVPMKQEESSGLQSPPARATNLLNGAQPALSSGGFDNRFAAWR